MNKLRRHFLAGILAVTPVALTGWIVWKIYIFVDGIVRPLLEQIPFLRDNIPPFINTIAGILLSAVVIMVIGVSARNLIGVAFFSAVDRVMNKIPVIKGIFNLSKQFSEVFLLQNNSAFQKVVLFEYPRNGVMAIGFVANENPDSDYLNVFIPTSPNPTSGFMLFVLKSEVKFLDISIEEAIRIVVSGGSLSTETTTKIFDSAAIEITGRGAVND